MNGFTAAWIVFRLFIWEIIFWSRCVSCRFLFVEDDDHLSRTRRQLYLHWNEFRQANIFAQLMIFANFAFLCGRKRETYALLESKLSLARAALNHVYFFLAGPFMAHYFPTEKAKKEKARKEK